MKILFYYETIRRGGAERVLSNLAKIFGINGYEVIFVVTTRVDNEYKLSENIKLINLNTSMFKLKKSFKSYLNLFFTTKRLRKVLKSENPDVIVAFSPLYILCAFFACLFLKTPLIVSNRIDPNIKYKNILKKKIAMLIFKYANGCVFQTKNEKIFFSDEIIKKSIIINNLVESKIFNTFLTSERKNIIGVGRLMPQKNWFVAIKAFSLISDKIQDNFIIYGIGDEQDRLQKYIEDLNLSDRVTLAGISSEIEKIVVNAKLFVMSSDYEGVPNALIEALIMGVPCVSTRFTGGGAEALIESGVNGILVTKGDYEAMAEAMFKVLSNNDYAEQLGKAAKERAREDFNPEKVFKQWENYVLTVIEKHKNKKI